MFVHVGLSTKGVLLVLAIYQTEGQSVCVHMHTAVSEHHANDTLASLAQAGKFKDDTSPIQGGGFGGQHHQHGGMQGGGWGGGPGGMGGGPSGMGGGPGGFGGQQQNQHGGGVGGGMQGGGPGMGGPGRF